MFEIRISKIYERLDHISCSNGTWLGASSPDGDDARDDGCDDEEGDGYEG